MEPQSQSDPLKKSVWSSELTSEAPSISKNSATTMPTESNPYVSAASPSSSSSSVKRRLGKKMGETTKAVKDLAGYVLQHLKTGPRFTDTAMGRIAEGAKLIAEGDSEKRFMETFETDLEEQLQRRYAWYLSTTAGPVMGILYLSTSKLAFCSDNPLSYKVGDETEWSYYKVVIPLHQLKAVNPLKSKVNRAKKYLQVICVYNNEFWFMGFVNYDSTVKFLQDALQVRNLESG